MLVRLNPGNFGDTVVTGDPRDSNTSLFKQVFTGGADIRFAKPNGVELPYQIARWVSAGAYNDTAEIWVLLDTIPCNTTTHSIVMYWGNPSATSASSDTAVFSTSNNFVAVWHMNDTGLTSGAAAVKDATKDRLNDTVYHMTSANSGAGIIGRAINFNGSDNYLSTPTIGTSGAPYAYLTHGITISAWIKCASLSSKWGLFNFGSGAAPTGNNIVFRDSTGTATAIWDLDTGNVSQYPEHDIAQNVLSTSSGWTHIAVTYDSTGGLMDIFENGQLVAGQPFPLTVYKPALASVSRTMSYIGTLSPTSGFFNGYIDELEMSAGTRPNISDWINLSYLSQQMDPARGVVCDSPIITQQPLSMFVPYPNTPYTFSTAAVGFNLTYQWQVSKYGGPFNNIAGATAAVYSGTAQWADSTDTLQCVVSSGMYHVTTTKAALSICMPATIPAGIPADINGWAGSKDSFYLTGVTGKPVNGQSSISYGWQQKIGNGAWTAASATNNTMNYPFTVSAVDTNTKFRCIAAGKCQQTTGSSMDTVDTSRAAIVHAYFHTAIITQPKGPTVSLGNWDTLTTVATGRNLQYCWQESHSNSPYSWTILTNIKGNSDTLPFKPAITDTGAWFRCLILGDDFDSTNAVQLWVCTPPSFSRQPLNTNAGVGNTISFTAAATGSGVISYQWQDSTTGGHYTNLSDTAGHYSGSATDSLSIVVAAGDTGSNVWFRCMATGQCGSAVSTKVQIIGCAPISNDTIVAPDTINASSGQQVSFTVNVSGSSPQYQWYDSTAGSPWVAMTGNPTETTNALTITTTSTTPSTWYRCVVSGLSQCNTQPDTSNVAYLSMCIPVTIISQTKDTTVMGEDTAVFTVHANGTGPISYQWYDSVQGQPFAAILGSRAKTLRFPTDTIDTNAAFECIVKGYCGTYDTTVPAHLRLNYPPVITQQPYNISNACPGSVDSLKVAATGIGTIYYQWLRSLDGGAHFQTIPNANSPVYLDAVSPTDTTTDQFQCMVTNSYGTGYASNTAKVSVAPGIGTVVDSPAAPAVIAGQTVAFQAHVASGIGLTYQWMRSPPPNYGVIDTIANATDSFYSLTTAIADSGSRFWCVVSNSCHQPVSSAPVVLTVYSVAHANFGESPSAGPIDPPTNIPYLSVQFSDSSTGNLSSWFWNFGDPSSGLKDTSTQRFPFHQYNSIGTYTVKLIVSGPSGTDSTTRTVFVYKLGGNPLTMTGHYVSDSQVSMTYGNYSGLTSSGGTQNVDSITVWYKLNGIPDSADIAKIPQNAKQIKTYKTLDSLKAHITDTLLLKGGVASGAIAGFNTQIFWTDGSATNIDTLNGDTVFMRAPPPPNYLQLSDTLFPGPN